MLAVFGIGALALLLIGLASGCAIADVRPGAKGVPAPDNDPISVLDFLPKGYVTDGSVSYVAELQSALDAAGRAGRTVVFAPITYLLDQAEGLEVHSNTTLSMYGARFVFAENLDRDGHAFHSKNVQNVRFQGGTVIGKRENWDCATNIAGIRIFGRCAGIYVRDMSFEDLSSNAIGMFADAEGTPITDVRIHDVITRRCCNQYTDYLEPETGPAKGSDRHDQGNIAFYFVNDWVVDGCLLEGSRSDGTHFYHSHQGRFTNNRVITSKMGGYFVEGCDQVLAANNLVSGNGSRGVTIERDSRFCTLQGNVVEFSGREGLWAPDIMGCTISGNIFRENGRKDDAERDSEIRIDNMERWETQTRDLQVVNNIFYTSEHQHSAVRVTEGVRQIVIRGNSFRGPIENDYIVVDKPKEDVIVKDNDNGG